MRRSTRNLIAPPPPPSPLVPEKKKLKNDTSGSIFPTLIFPTHAGKGQIPHSPGTEDSQIPGVCSGVGGGGMLKFRLYNRRIRRSKILKSHYHPPSFLFPALLNHPLAIYHHTYDMSYYLSFIW